MIPTFNGRIQTRILLVLLIGVPWTLIITPFLPGNRGGLGLGKIAGELYPATFTALAIILVVGVVLWEPIYYVLQLCRWEKDWPVMFFMLELIPEAVLAWYIFKEIGPDTAGIATKSTYITHVCSTWVLMFLFVLGPIKVLFIRWRFNGGRIV